MVPQISLPRPFSRCQKRVEGAWLVLIITFSFRRIMGFVVCALRLQQGHSVRIMYVHVPAAAVAQSCYLIMAISSAVFLYGISN